MQNLRLLIGPDRLKVDSEEISAVSVNYSLKDVKNYGQINSSYSKSITILHTKNTDRIFKGIFNINSYGGFDPGVKVYGELEEDSVTILKGTLQLINAGINYYEVVLYANTVSIFAEIGDKLIIGNTDVNDDLQFDPSLFYHNWSRSKVREMLSVDPSKDGTGYCYPIINYDNKITWPFNLDFNVLYPDRLTDDYLIFPAVAAKQIFDKIFEENNYTYVVSPEIEQILKELYIPFNEEYLNRTTNWLYSKVYLGNPTDCSYTDTTVELGAIPFGSWFTSQVIPINSVKGFTFYDNFLPNPSNHVSGGFDYMHNYPSNWNKFDGEWYATTYYLELPHAGNYTIDVSMWLYNTAGASGSTEWSITTWNSIDGNVAYNIGDLDLNAHTGGYLTGSVNVAVSEKSSLAIHRSTGSSTSINLIFGPWSYITITENNSFIGGNTYFELNNMLPRNYKQKDFINDILKMFNAYVYVDEIDERKLYIKTHDEFYGEGNVYDWTNKMAKNANLKHRPLKNTFAKTTTIGFTDDNDIYSQDYLSKYPIGIYSKQVFNDSEFSAEQNEIKLSSSPGVITFIPGSNSAVSRYTTRKPDGVHALVISDDKTFKTAYKPRILFSNTVDISTHLYGSDSSTLGFTKWTTLSPRRYVDPSAENNIFLGFDSEDTYASVLTECNRNLYNLYYKSDIESNIGDDARILEGEFELNANDIHEVKFNDKIWIADPEIGNAYYRLNAIKDYNPGLGSERQLTKVELIKINLIDDSYSDVISTERIYKSTIGGTSSGTSSSSSSAPSSGGGGGTLQEVTDAGNITTNDIVLQNATEPTSQVALGANEDDELTIDGVSIEDKFMHQIETGNHFLISSAGGDASISDAFMFDDTSVCLLRNNLEIGGGSTTTALLSRKANTSGNQGALNIYGSSSISTENAGLIRLNGGNSTSSGKGGAAQLIGGRCSSSGNGGSVAIQGGAAYYGVPGELIIEGGSAFRAENTNIGGKVTITGGPNWFGGNGGNVLIGGGYGKTPHGKETNGILKLGLLSEPYNSDYQSKIIELYSDVSLLDTNLFYGNDFTSHTPFVSGFTGDGYQLTKEANGDYRLELDNLYVRGSLTAYEMILHKIRALNGNLWVSSAVEAVWPGKASTYIPAGLYYEADSSGYFTAYFFTDTNNNTLVKDDYIRSQQFLGNNIHQIDWVVTDSSGTQIFVRNLPQNRMDYGCLAGGLTFENIDCSTFTDTEYGYTIDFEAGQSCKTLDFIVNGPGTIRFGLNNVYVAGSGNLTLQLFDSSDNALSSAYSYDISDETLYLDFSIGDTFGGDSSCYILVKNNTAGTLSVDEWIGIGLTDYTIPYRDVTGFTFVRRGNPTDENRQGALYLTADDSNAPFLEVLDGMTSHDIQAENRKVRLGKLDGLTWRDSSIGGYGLWTDSAYLSGAINAESGLIGNFEIDNGQLIGTGSNNDRIILDPGVPSLRLTDASQSIVAEVTNQPILSIDDIQSTTEILYAGSEADTYTDVNQQYPQSSYYSGARYWRPTIYIKNHQTTGNTDLDASTSERDNTFDIQVEDGGTYSVNMSVNVNVTTLLPESSAGGYHTPPSYDVPEEPVEVEKHFYSLGGYYTINASTYFFAGDDTSLGNTHKTNFGSLTSSLSNWQVVTNKSITATDTSVYIKLVPEIKNALYALDYVEYWYSVENEYGEWVWQEVYSTTMDRDVSTLFNIEVEQLGLNGRLQKTQIGQDGILTYWNSDKYFTVNNREDPLIQSAGGWTHNMTSSQNIRINHNGESATFNTPFALACAEQGWMMILQNKRANSDAQGILLDTGKTSGSNTSMTFRTYNGNSVGSITHNGTNATYGTSSDARLKGNIRDASIDALELIKSLPVREWEWNTTGENDCGFVAQEVLEIYPRMVQVPRDPSTEYYGVGTQHLVPILVKALQEAMERIEKLEEDILILKG